MRYLLFILFFSVCISCGDTRQKVKDEVKDSVEKVKSKIKKTWSDALDKAMEYNADKSTKKITFKEYFPSSTFTINEIDGLWSDMPMGFYFCFLKYKADRSEVLSYISNLETKLPDISDATIKDTDSTKLFENLRFVEQDYPKLKEKLSFFYELKSKKNLEFFECNKYPNSHHIAFDPEAGIIYHHFEKYWD